MTGKHVVVIVGDAKDAECARALACYPADTKISRMSLHYLCLSEEAVAELAGYHSVQDMWSAMPTGVKAYAAKYEEYVQHAVQVVLERLKGADALVIRDTDWELGQSDELLLPAVHERLFQLKPSLELYLLHSGWTELQTQGSARSI